MNNTLPRFPHTLGVVTAIIGVVLIISTFVPHTSAAAVTWTTDADFSTWDHYDTIGSSDSVILTKVVTHQMLPGTLAVPVYNSGVVFDSSSSNQFYIFGGSGDAASTPHLRMDAVQQFSSSPDTGSATLLSNMEDRRLPLAIYSNKGGSRKAYVVGGITYNVNDWQDDNVLRYNLLAPQNAPTEMPLLWTEGPDAGGVLDPTVANTDEMLLFHSNRVWRYKPFLPETTLVATLPYEWSRTKAIWSPANNKIYLIGGSTNTIGGSWESRILEFDPVTYTSTILPGRLPFGMRDIKTTYNSQNNKIYFYTSDSSHLYEFNPYSKSVSQLSTTLGTMTSAGVALNTVTNTPYLFGDYNLQGNMSKLLYSANNAQSGYATKVFTPAAGGVHDWTSAIAGITSNNGSITMQYTSNTDCSTGLTSDITAVPNSESLCIRANFTATSPTLTGPSLNDLTINYTVVSTPTPTPSGTSLLNEDPCTVGLPTFSTPYPSGSPVPSPSPTLPTPPPSPSPTTITTTPTPTPTPTPTMPGPSPTFFTPTPTPTPAPTFSFPFPTPP